VPNPYDTFPYRTFPRRQTHPDRLAAVGRLFGMNPAPVTHCRLLEIGCGSGGNIVPLAYTLPDSRFLGIDLAAEPLSQAREMAEALELRNIDLRVMDLRDPTEGEFDYIVAHGIYSWVPATVRDALLAACRERLAPQGIAFISYNAWPGQHERQILHQMLRYRGDNVETGREFLRTLDRAEASALADSPDDLLFHDILAHIRHPVWFHEFTAHAVAQGLRYLGEADVHEMFDPSGSLVDEAGEQALDFRKFRSFRQTLLCRAEVELTRAIAPAQMDPFLFSRNSHGRRIAGTDPSVEAVSQALDDMHPLPVTFEDLVPYAGAAADLREILFGLLAAGCADLHVYDFPCADSPGDRPLASRLARYQAERGSLVTNLCHMPVQLDEVSRQLLLLLDGTRTVSSLARKLAALPGAGDTAQIRRALPESLAWLAKMALLEE
jgi:SAM-dependent methyltransferase